MALLYVLLGIALFVAFVAFLLELAFLIIVFFQLIADEVSDIW